MKIISITHQNGSVTILPIAAIVRARFIRTTASEPNYNCVLDLVGGIEHHLDSAAAAEVLAFFSTYGEAMYEIYIMAPKGKGKGRGKYDVFTNRP